MWFDGVLGRNVEVYRSTSSLVVLAAPGTLVQVMQSELVAVYGAEHTRIDNLQLAIDVSAATAAKLADLGGIVPFERGFLKSYADHEILRVHFKSRSNLTDEINEARSTGLSLEVAVTRRGEQSFPSAFALPNYHFADLSVLSAKP